MSAWTGQAHGVHSKLARNLHHHSNQIQHIYEGDRRVDKTIGDHTHETRRQQKRDGESIERETQTNTSYVRSLTTVDQNHTYLLHAATQLAGNVIK